MSTTTSSEEKPRDEESTQRGFDTPDDYDQPIVNYAQPERAESGHGRKRRRTESEKARETRMQRFAKSRLKEIEAHRTSSADSRRRRTPSVDPSRSDNGSQGSLVPRYEEVRTGKRVRRRPQRWEGERVREQVSPYGAQRYAKYREGVSPAANDDSTASLQSALSLTEVPTVESPFEDLKKALAAAVMQPSRRDVVDWFHSWQLRAVSKQAGQQKALHVFLKRRLRRRTTRSPEYDRMEEDALRSARCAIVKPKRGHDDPDHETNVEDEMNGEIVPGKFRLPLEAYLPRRVKSRSIPLTPSQFMHLVPDAPRYPGTSIEKDDDGEQKWMSLPTVTASAQWNARKSTGRRDGLGVKNESARIKDEAVERMEPE